jgi:hypothetical protein
LSLPLKLKPLALLAAGALALGACGSSSKSSDSSMSTTTTAMSSSVSDIKTAADLRASLDSLLGEHIILASKATGAALNGQTAEFNAYGTQLNDNGNKIGDIFGAVGGDSVKTQFNTIWSAHDGFFVDYTKAVAAKDTAKQTEAVNNLTNQYVPQFTNLVVSATGLPEATVKTLVTEHVTQTKAIVDDQAAKNWSKEYSDIGTAYTHMSMIGDPVAKAISDKNASKFPASDTQSASDLRVSLDSLLQEHLYLATFATDAALNGRSDEFTAASTALNTNGTDLGSAIGSVYGAAAQAQFNTIWSAHNGFFVDYTKAVAAKDEAGKSAAVSKLTGTYIPQFTDFLVNATGLPKDTVTSLVTDHVTETKGVVDAQAAGNWTDVANQDVAAGEHMKMIGDPLAQAIVKKFPDKFSK